MRLWRCGLYGCIRPYVNCIAEITGGLGASSFSNAISSASGGFTLKNAGLRCKRTGHSKSSRGGAMAATSHACQSSVAAISSARCSDRSSMSTNNRYWKAHRVWTPADLRQLHPDRALCGIGSLDDLDGPSTDAAQDFAQIVAGAITREPLRQAWRRTVAYAPSPQGDPSPVQKYRSCRWMG